MCVLGKRNDRAGGFDRGGRGGRGRGGGGRFGNEEFERRGPPRGNFNDRDRGGYRGNYGNFTGNYQPNDFIREWLINRCNKHFDTKLKLGTSFLHTSVAIT